MVGAIARSIMFLKMSKISSNRSTSENRPGRISWGNRSRLPSMIAKMHERVMDIAISFRGIIVVIVIFRQRIIKKRGKIFFQIRNGAIFKYIVMNEN